MDRLRAIWSATYFGEGHRVWVSSKDQLVFVDRFEMFQVGVDTTPQCCTPQVGLDRIASTDEILRCRAVQSYVMTAACR